MEPLRVHGLNLSYFTGKLEGYLRGKGIPYTLIEMDTRDFKQCGKATGVAQMPQVEWKEGQWLSDTNLILDFMEQEYPGHTITPANPGVQFLAKMLEDFADEWLWRPALYHRWANAEDAQLMSSQLARTMMRDVPLPLFMRRQLILNRQRLHFLLLDGYSPRTAKRIEAHYLECLDALEHIFRVQPFVLGLRPTAADYGFFGSMYRHFFSDPTPARIMGERAPAVMEWVSRMWNLNIETLEDLPFPSSLSEVNWAALRPLLKIVDADFLPYMQANEQAVLGKQRHVKFESAGVAFKTPRHIYRAWRFQRLRKRFQAQAGEDRVQIKAASHTLAQALGQPVHQALPDAIPSLPIPATGKKKMLGHKW